MGEAARQGQDCRCFCLIPDQKRFTKFRAAPGKGRRGPTTSEARGKADAASPIRSPEISREVHTWLHHVTSGASTELKRHRRAHRASSLTPPFAETKWMRDGLRSEEHTSELQS